MTTERRPSCSLATRTIASMEAVSSDGSNTTPQLPPEILLEVFKQYRAIHPPQSYSWIQLTHVCRFWREVALESGQFWSTIPLRKLANIPELLNRSKQAPLTIVAHEDGVHQPLPVSLYRQIFGQLSRIHDMHLSIHDRALKEVIANHVPVVDTALPLVRLKLIVPGQSYDPPQIHDLFAPEMPYLRELYIDCHSGCQWTQVFFPRSLRHLHIIQRNRTPRKLPDMLAALAGTPFLVTLELKGMLPWFDPAAMNLPEVSNPLVLPHLTDLHLDSSATRCAWFLANVSLPGLIELQIRCVVTCDTAVEVLASALTDKVADSDGTFEAQHLKSFIIDESYGSKQTRICGWTSSDAYPVSTEKRRAGHMRTVYITFVHLAERHRDTPIRVCQFMPLSHVKDLYVCLGSSLYAPFADCELEAWRQGFASTTEHTAALETLHVFGKREPIPFRPRTQSHDPTHRRIDPSDCVSGVSPLEWREMLLPELRRIFPAMRNTYINQLNSEDIPDRVHHSDRNSYRTSTSVPDRKLIYHIL